MKKLTFKEVKQYFEDHDCELLETEYINSGTPMKYICKCKNKKCKITFYRFKKGERCMECSGNKKYTYEEVKKYFKDHDCKLLEKEYVNSKTKMKYECKCGNKECKITFSNFKRGQRCRKCCGSEKLTFEVVYNYFKEHNCLLLETEYIDNQTPMEYICECNRPSKIRFGEFKKGTRCYECGIKKSREKQSFTYKYVYNYFLEHNCLLLEKEYKNNHTKMEYKCDCGNPNICKITFKKFKIGQRCKICKIKKRYLNYNPDLTNEERKKDRSRPGCNKWRRSIKERDNNICQCCFQEERKLIAHHIGNYANNKELRTIVSNGFLFCEKHHIDFHKKYGYNCNRAQLEEFLKILNNNSLIF